MAILSRRLLGAALALAVLFVCAPVTLAHADDKIRADQLDRYLRARMDATNLPGAAYAVVSAGGIEQQGVFGHDGDGGAITDTTPFLWGSVAKPVTATLIMTMVATGELRLDEPVTSYLPTFRTRDSARSARITLRHLLAQTSGLPTSTRHTDRTDPRRRPQDVLGELASTATVSEPGAAHHYSSTNYLLLSAVVEAVTGRPFRDVLTERVLDPLGMRTAVTTADQARDTLPRGHRYLFGQPVAFAPPFDPAGAGYGYLGGSLRDLAAFARASLTGGVLTDEQRDLMFRGDARTGPGQRYGLGWRRWPLDGTDISMVWHGGANPGYFAAVILLPDRAVVFLANAYGTFHEPGLLDTGFGLATLASGAAPPKVSADHTYSAILTGLSIVATALAVLVAWSIRTLVRPAPATAHRRRLLGAAAAWTVCTAAVLYTFAIALPGHFGVGLTQIPLWTPDIGWLVYAVLTLAGVLLGCRIAVAARGLRGSRTVPEPLSVV